MIIETLPSGLSLPKIGFGMWKIGGDSSPDPSRDQTSQAALAAALNIGYTHFDTAESYARGRSEEMLAQALRTTNTPRSKIFITTKVHPGHLRHADLIAACNNSLRRLETDYIDLYLIHWPGSTPLEESFSALNQLQREGKIRHIGVSNFGLDLMKRAAALCETPLATNQVAYSVSDSSYVHNGVLEYCQENGIFLTAYSPVDEGRLRVTGALREAAR